MISRILGVDPGFGRTGYGLLAIEGANVRFLEAGCIETSTKLAFEDRLHELFQQFTALLKRTQPTRAGIEQVLFSKNVKTALDVSQARGVFLLALTQHAIPVEHVTPTEVKSRVTGFGQADKTQVQRMVMAQLKLADLPKPDDAADALAIALAISHLH